MKSYAPGSLGWAVTRAQWRALGLSEDDLRKPKIAVVNTSSAFAVCFAHLDSVSRAVQAGVREAGGVAFEVRTAAASDGLFFATGCKARLKDARELMAREVEMAVGGAALDGMVLLSSCDSTTPAHLIAAARLDIPALIVPCGYQGWGAGQGVLDVYEGVGAVAVGRMAAERLGGVADGAIGCMGVCGGLGTANTMHMLAEALGMALAGSAPIRGDSPRLPALAREAGLRIVGLQRRPRELLDAAALRRAVRLLVATGGATSCVGHLQALSDELGLDLDIRAEIAALDGVTPTLCAAAPAGDASMETIEAAGGAQAVLARLDGKELGGETIRPLDAPLSRDPGVMVLRGSLGEGLTRPAIAPMRRFSGPARLLAGAEAAFDALAAGAIRPGDALVIAGGIDDFACALHGAALSQSVALLSDGGFSGLSRGLCVGHIRGLPALRDGETITIDLDHRSLDRV
jgi:dihydroxy-acid dehydratase